MESTGISEPQPVAETLTFAIDEQADRALGDIARLDTLVIVVDGCLLTDAEWAAGPEEWLRLPDPFPEWDVPPTLSAVAEDE